MPDEIKGLFVILGVIVAGAGGGGFLLVVWWVVLTCARNLWLKTVELKYAREAYVFYKSYHGQLENGKLICPACKDI